MPPSFSQPPASCFRSWSVDATLNQQQQQQQQQQQRHQQQHQNGGGGGGGGGGKLHRIKSGGMFGSFERGLDKVKSLWTSVTNKSKANHECAEPRRVKVCARGVCSWKSFLLMTRPYNLPVVVRFMKEFNVSLTENLYLLLFLTCICSLVVPLVIGHTRIQCISTRSGDIVVSLGN